jgi:hypothetical protein
MTINARLTAMLGLALALGACGSDEPSRQPGQASAAPVTQGGPAARVVKYDGTYAGSVTATSGAYSCPNAVRGNRSMTISYGRALLDMNPGRSSPLQGLVQEDGSLRATDQIDRFISVTGTTNGEQFAGTWVQGRCVYTLNFRRTG